MDDLLANAEDEHFESAFEDYNEVRAVDIESFVDRLDTYEIDGFGEV